MSERRKKVVEKRKRGRPVVPGAAGRTKKRVKCWACGERGYWKLCECLVRMCDECFRLEYCYPEPRPRRAA